MVADGITAVLTVEAGFNDGYQIAPDSSLQDTYYVRPLAILLQFGGKR